jgi:hypothetical protein
MLEGMSRFADVARFGPFDPQELITASLACPFCLRGEDIAWGGTLEGHDPSVRCHCPGCGEAWRVYLAPDQALRVALISHAQAA